MSTLHGIDTSVLTFSCRSDLFDNGRHCEDGSPLVGSHHYVVAISPDGRRFMRNVGTSSWMYDVDEDTGEPCYYRSTDPTDLDNLADIMVEKLSATEVPELNECMWHEAEAAYGTQAHTSEQYSELGGLL